MLPAAADPRRRQAFALLAVAALLMHLVLLGGVDLSAPPLRQTGSAPAVQVRSVPAPVAPMVQAEPPAPAPVPMRAVRKPAGAVTAPAAAAAAPVEVVARPAEPMAEAPGETVPETPGPAASQATAAAPADTAAAPASAPADAEGSPPPVYATRLPPAVTLRYELQRGRLTGSGELRWRPEGEGYELRLEGSVVGLNVLTQVSQGALGPAGLAPARFTDQRARRAAVAANFEREAGRIRFSGPSTELPWLPGVQDRLSWMVQLGAVASAEPQRLAAGERITLQVVGARGDSSLWSFRSAGPQTLQTRAGPVETVHLLREPRTAHDTRVEVWLDPARHHLPVRATLGSGDDDRLELRLREFIPGG